MHGRRDPRPDILGLDLAEIEAHMRSLEEPAYRAVQVFQAVHRRAVTDFDEIKVLPAVLRKRLAADFTLRALRIVRRRRASDGTTKSLFALEDGEEVESVVIPSPRWTTVCVSSQAGCKFGCRFCASGIGGWRRHLTTAEIVGQILSAARDARRKERPLTHIVVMGTGEGLDNYENLMRALRIVNDPRGLRIGARRITVSTVGLVPGILRFAREERPFELAVSLHGYDDASRGRLMPVNRRYPFTELIAACREFVVRTGRQITFEYILIKGLTCTEEAVGALARRLEGLVCQLNLIPYNPVREFPYSRLSWGEMQDFRRRLARAGLPVTLRRPRGRGIAAACGQLRHVSRTSAVRHAGDRLQGGDAEGGGCGSW